MFTSSGRRRHGAGRALVGVALLWAAGANTAWAQAATPKQAQTPKPKPPPKPKGPPKWTLDVHGGSVFGHSPTGGDALAQFPSGLTFATKDGRLSRFVSSWYFGDGTVLFNQVNAQLATVFGVNVPPMASLDDTLKASGARRGAGGSFGVRLTRRLSARVEAEFSFDWNGSRLTLRSAPKTAIEASSASFQTAFASLIATASPGAQVTSTAELPKPAGHQTSFTGALNFSLMTRGRLEVHATAGMGVVVNAGNTSDVKLTGRYEFVYAGAFPFSETDTVTIHFTDRDRALAGVFGGGITRELSKGRGIRVDARVYVSKGGLGTSVDATPIVRQFGPFDAAGFNTNPSIQFSNSTGVRSSLSGPAVTNLTTFTGKGLDVRVHLNVGYFFRF